MDKGVGGIHLHEYALNCENSLKIYSDLVLQGALCVEVTGGVETSTTIMFLTYDPGDAPVRVDNLCEDVFIKLHQK